MEGEVSTPKHKVAVDPACLHTLAQLEKITNVDEHCFLGWLRAHERTLKHRFMFSAEPDDQAGAWLRFEYVRALGRIP
jgi:hypothetical protein